MRLLNSYTDDQLVALLMEDSEAAYNEIYDRYWLKLYNECYKRLKDESLCADVIQDIFADLWLKREERKIENLAAYLFSAARYQIFSLHKKNKDVTAFIDPIECMAVAATDPASAFYEKELRECIEMWLAMQPEKRKQVFIMKFDQELSTREISEILNVSQNTVQNQFTTSIKSLRVHLGKIISVLVIM